MNNQIVVDALYNTLNASKDFVEDKKVQQKLKDTIARLIQIKKYKYELLQEWVKDVDDKKNQHYHISHFYDLFPTNKINQSLRL